MLNIGIIGLGYWGPNLYRNFSDNKKCKVTAICDLDANRSKRFLQIDNKLRYYQKYSDLIKDNSLDAIVIATPVKTHYKIAINALKNRKHVFVEKPLSDNSLNCKRLIEYAKKHKLKLFVDHTFLYTDAVRKIKELTLKKSFGETLYYDSTRINLGLVQSDVNVLWDLAVHDLAILDFIKAEMPTYVSAVGINSIKSKPVSIAYLTLKYKSNFVAHINVNWLSPVKIRKTLIAGSNKMILYNDLEPSDKIRLFDKGVNVISDESSSKNLVKYRVGDTSMPFLQNKEALATAVIEFIDSIVKDRSPLTSGESGLRIVQILRRCFLIMMAQELCC